MRRLLHCLQNIKSTEWFILFILIGMILLIVGIAHHYSDKHTPGIRYSAHPLTVFIDVQTGCEYLGLSSYSLIPRVDTKGKHICNLERIK